MRLSTHHDARTGAPRRPRGVGSATVTSGLPCPCGIAASGVIEATDPAQAIAAYERAALHALAVGAQLDADRHATGDTVAGPAGELNLIARQLRIAHAQFEQHLADTPPPQSTPARQGDALRCHARALTQIAARLYCHAARDDTPKEAPPTPVSTTDHGNPRT